MRIYDGKEYRDMTASECLAYKAAQEEAERYEATRPLTAEERIAELEEALALLLSGVTE